jgi:hypothetical protein
LASTAILIVLVLEAAMNNLLSWDAAGAIGTCIGTLAAPVVDYFIWKTSKRVEWLTGSLESSQMTTLRLDVKEHHQDVELIWWDPTIKPWPHSGKHGEKVETKRIYLGLPLQ